MPRPRSGEDLVTVTAQYPRALVTGLRELVQASHISKVHHLREALRRHLDAGWAARPVLWEFCGGQVPVVTSSLDGEQASEAELCGLLKLAERLRPLKLEVYPSWQVTPQSWRLLSETGVVVLGGPRTNHVAAEILRAWEGVVPVQISEHPGGGSGGYAVRNVVSGEAWLPDNRADRGIPSDLSDFGLIVKCASPMGGGTCLLLAGCHALGTYAAVHGVTDETCVQQLRSRLPSDDAHFAAVVHARVRNSAPEMPGIVDVVVLRAEGAPLRAGQAVSAHRGQRLA